MAGSISIDRQKLANALREEIANRRKMIERHRESLRQNGGNSADPLDHASILEISSNDTTCIQMMEKAIQEAEETLLAIETQEIPVCKICHKPMADEWERIAIAHVLTHFNCALRIENNRRH